MTQQNLATRRGKALLKAVEAAKLKNLSQLATALQPGDAKKAGLLRLELYRASKGERLLSIDRATEIARHLEIQPSQLYINMTEKEQEKNTEAPVPTEQPAAKKTRSRRNSPQKKAWADFHQLRKERSTLLKQAARDKGLNANQLHGRLVQAGKNWNLKTIKDCMNGRRLPSQEFLEDVSPMLGVEDPNTLIIRTSNFEKVGRQKAGATQEEGRPPAPKKKEMQPGRTTNEGRDSAPATNAVGTDTRQLSLDVVLPKANLTAKVLATPKKDGDKRLLLMEIEVTGDQLLELYGL